MHLTSSEAVAHPFGNRFAAQSLEVRLHPDAIEVALRADVPFELLDLLARGATPPDEVVLSDLVGGLTLKVDGQELALTEVRRSSQPDLVDGEGRVLSVAWRAPIDLTGRHELSVGNANLAETPCWFHDRLELTPGMVVHATSLRTAARGEVRWLDTSWLRAERLRGVTLEVDLPDDPWSRAWRAAPAPLRGVRDAWHRPVARAWRDGTTDARTTALAAVLAALGGLGAGAVGGRAARLPALAAVALAAVAVVLPLGGAAEALRSHAGMTGLLWPIAALVAAREPDAARWAPWLMLPWLLVAVDPPWTPGVLCVGAVALGAGWLARLRPRAAAILLLLAGLVALTRG